MKELNVIMLLCFLLFVSLASTSTCSPSSSSSSLISSLINGNGSRYTHSLSLKTQASILVSLKQSFHEEAADHNRPSLLTYSWNLSNYRSLCSNWTGVTCDHRLLVVSLDISSLNLSGFFSPVITQLRSLRSLNISNNQFTGELHKFSLLDQLQVLDLYNNNFSGPLPLAVTRMPNLIYLHFGGNYFSGQIPPSYATLRQLNYLSLAGNELRGSIPSELGNLTSLRHLYLGYFNQFDGGIPVELGKLAGLIHLDLASCGLQGPIPPELGNLTKLDTLYLQQNQLSGSIPPQLGNLTRLQYLDLSSNALSGEIPTELSPLKQLKVLYLFFNRFHGDVPGFIAEFPDLQMLQLWQNNFTGTIPPKLGLNSNLTTLDLSTNKLTGRIPDSLCRGRKLNTLILFNNFLFGPLPDDLGECQTLTKVRIGQNYLSGSLPQGFLFLPILSLVELQNNYLTGLGMENGGQRKEIRGNNTNTRGPSKVLEQLNLSNNRLSGSIPTFFRNFSNLKILLLSGNYFSGAIPGDIGHLRSLLKLDMSRNNFSGRIPPDIGNFSSLTYLDLSQNRLTGPMPPQITEIRILNYLNVSWNHLNGSLPEGIGSMKSLTSADFSHNNFSGPIPETGQYSIFNSTSFLGNPNLCSLSYLNRPCNSNSSDDQMQQLNHQGAEGKSKKVPGKYKLVFALGLLICSLVFVVFAIIRVRKYRKMNKGSSWKLTAFQKVEFGSGDILECLKDNNIIGQGGAGVVYGGTMPNGEQVAIKKLGISKVNDNGLSAEIQTLGRIRHRYIVRLIAFCSNKETNLLVYEYMPNGSLGEVLHGKNKGGNCLLKWDTRLKIAIEAAKGLCYLHHDCSPLIIHRDVKSNNILLSSDFEAHVADFGLAKFLQGGGASECMSAIAGSYGYIAPEYAYTLKVDEKSDVYSYGVVLLELLTGRRPVGDFGEEGLDIVQWTKIQTDWKKERVVKILDERLKNVPTHESMQVFFVAMLCVQEHSVERPTMREVVQMLAQAKQPNTFQMH